MKEKHFQTQPVRERRSAFGPNTSPDTGSEHCHDARPHAPLNAGPESAPVSASERGLDGGLARDPGSGTRFAHDTKAAEQDKPGLGPGSLDTFDPARRRLYAEALKACHLEKRRGFREFVRRTNPEWDAAPALRPVPDDQPRSHGRSSRYQSRRRRPPEANAARLLDYLQGDFWQSDAPRSLESESEEQGRPSTLGEDAKPRVQASAPVPSEPHRNIQDRTANPLNFESLIEAKARKNAPDTETEAKAKAKAETETEAKTKEAAPDPESARKSALQPSALSRDCEPRGDGSDTPKARPALRQGETTRGNDRHPRGLAHFFALCKRLARKFF